MSSSPAVLVAMSPAAFGAFLPAAIASYAAQNIASGRWPADTALELSRAEHQRLLPDGVATRDMHLFEIRDPTTNATVGTLWLAVQSATGTRTGYVFSVDIAEPHRRQGHAKRAFVALETIGRELGLASIGLNVFAFNTAARGLYEAMGYEVSAMTMRKSLQR